MAESVRSHNPVLLKELIQNMDIKKEGIYLDATLGCGGHAEAILNRLGSRGRLIGIDCDEEAIKEAGKLLAPFGKQVVFVRDNYRNIAVILKTIKIDKVDGIILDLGVSSLQLDSPERGFSFRFNSRIDMRMDSRSRLKAGDLINQSSEEELRRIFYQFGEERYSKKIVENIVRYRDKEPIKTTLQLVEIIEKSLPKKNRVQRIHPATRIFQALRIAVNQELNNLNVFLKESVGYLKKGGRMAVISYHSLEDRIVKQFFKDLSKSCICPPDFPVCCCKIIPELKILTGKPLRPEKREIEKNPRARSAKLRVAEKL